MDIRSTRGVAVRDHIAANLGIEPDDFEPSLRLHPLTGKLQGMQAVSLTYSYRITLTLQIIEHEILRLDVGSHDEVYG